MSETITSLEKVNDNTSNIRIEIAESLRTARRSNHYFAAFYYENRLRDLEGKKILDVGAGDSDFSAVARILGARVINLDPKYLDRMPSDKQDAIIGAVQDLPFASSTFDEVLASYSIFWVRTRLRSALEEMLRITMTGGNIKIHPASWNGILHPTLPPCLALLPTEDGVQTLQIHKAEGINWGSVMEFILSHMIFDGMAAMLKDQNQSKKYQISFNKIINPETEISCFFQPSIHQIIDFTETRNIHPIFIKKYNMKET